MLAFDKAVLEGRGFHPQFLMMINGTADTVVPWEGSASPVGSEVNFCDRDAINLARS